MGERCCDNCNYKNFPPDAIPCVYCIDRDEFVQVERDNTDDDA